MKRAHNRKIKKVNLLFTHKLSLQVTFKQKKEERAKGRVRKTDNGQSAQFRLGIHVFLMSSNNSLSY